jgi:hypothetical protein
MALTGQKMEDNALQIEEARSVMLASGLTHSANFILE